MSSFLIAILLGMFLYCNTVDATAKESMEVRVYDPNFKMSDVKTRELLRNVDLEKHNYTKEITSKLVSQSGSGSRVYQKSYRFYKEVDCSKLQEIDQELQNLLPGIFGTELIKKINKEIASKDLNNMKKCQVGLQVHFKEAEGCYDKKKKVRRRKRSCNDCNFCWNAELAN